MMADEERPLRRNQKRIDALGYILQANRLLDDDRIDELAHHLGELEDWALTFPGILDCAKVAMEQLETMPKNAHRQLNALCGWFVDLRMHMDGAERLIDQVCDEIRRRNPTVFPWGDDE